MATSGSSNFSRTRDQLIARALRIGNVIESGETPSAEMTSNCSEALEAMVKAWGVQGYHLWTTQEAVLHLVKGQQSYDLGLTSTDHATLDSDAKKTELSVAGVATDGTITVDSDDDIAASDVIGIQHDDGTLQWTTVNGAPAADVVTLTVALTGAAAIDNHVYTYTSELLRPLRVTNIRRRDESANEVPIDMVSRQVYQDTPNKTTQGSTTQVWYDPKRETLGTLWIWPTSDSVQDRLVFTAHLPIEDFDAAANTPDLPQEWIDCIAWNLMNKLRTEFSLPKDLRDEIKQEARETLGVMMSWDQEPESVFFQPDQGP